MCRCGCNGSNGYVAPIAPAAPNVGLTYVPTIQTPTQQATDTTKIGALTPSRDWLDYVLLALAFIAAVNATKS